MEDGSVTVAEVIAERVAEVRERRGYSLRELSRRLDEQLGHRMDPSALKRLEDGERRPTVEDVLAVALALDVSPDALVLPLRDDVEVRVAPGFVRKAGKVRDWFSGWTLLLHPVPADEEEVYRRGQAWRTERPLYEQRAFFTEDGAATGAATLLAEAHRYVQALGRAPDTTGSITAPGERRRSLEAMRAEVERQLEAIDREEG